MIIAQNEKNSDLEKLKISFRPSFIFFDPKMLSHSQDHLARIELSPISYFAWLNGIIKKVSIEQNILDQKILIGHVAKGTFTRALFAAT